MWFGVCLILFIHSLFKFVVRFLLHINVFKKIIPQLNSTVVEMDICYYTVEEYSRDAEYYYTGWNLKTLSIVNLFKRRVKCNLQHHRSTTSGLHIGDLIFKSMETVGVIRFMSTGAGIEIIQTKELRKLRGFLVASWPLCSRNIIEVGRVQFSGGKALRTSTFQRYPHLWRDTRNAPAASANNCILFELVTQIVLLKIYFMPIYILKIQRNI